MASPNYVPSAGTFTGDATLALSATYSFQTAANTPNISNVAGDLAYYPYFQVTFGTVAATAGVQINAYRMTTSTPTNDTQPTYSAMLNAVGSTTQRLSFELGPGDWYFTATNLDAANAVTNLVGGYDKLTQ